MKHARLRALAVAAICLVGMAPTAAGATVAGGGSGAPAVNAPGLHFGITKRACGAGSPGMATCFAVRRVPVERGTDGAEPYTISSSYAVGPDGGYTPSDLLTAYGLTSLPTSAGSGQTVAVVDAYNNPNALADLNHFDGNYGLNPETSLTFQILNQNGGTSPLPANDTAGWSVEESLDVDAVRAICPNCKILLVEANSSSTANLSAAVAAAAAAGATEISNSYGSPEGTTAWSASQKNTEISAYNFPGVVVTASTGDDGWYGWDFSNGGSSQNSPETPATVPGVVAVGGTSLILNSNGTRKTEAVWNENGPEDKQTTTHGLGQAGASGGGCSKQFSAEPWQSNMSGFASTGCGTARLAADVSALADPYTGFDSYDSYDCGAACGGAPDWATYGGTSLASPLVAAMWALAGGAQGVSYPSLSLYGHANSTTTHLYDVTSGYEAFAGVLASGGNDWCDGDDQATCAAATNTGFGTTNPNGRGKGMLACGFDSGGATVANDTQCRAVAGFDGPSGVGAPSGIGAFAPLTPTPAFSAPTAAPGVAANFSGSATDPFPGGSIVSYSWHWGDGSSDTTGASPAHTFAAAGTYTVKLTATDNYGQVGTVSHDLAVGTPVQPSIASVTPNSGPAAGGTTITITGTGFVAGSTTVAIGQGSSKPRIDATDVTVISPTQLTAVTAGPAKTGAYWVYVTTPGGTSVPAGATKYTYTR
ncbi:MAG TPA: PKD domain-containing protein [Mycobacteriales bacterium]|nr:PKD domain-containing protein [Mycobacteriales bacterium]